METFRLEFLNYFPETIVVSQALFLTLFFYFVENKNLKIISPKKEFCFDTSQIPNELLCYKMDYENILS